MSLEQVRELGKLYQNERGPEPRVTTLCHTVEELAEELRRIRDMLLNHGWQVPRLDATLAQLDAKEHHEPARD
jgi:hypothetical protein